MKKLAIAVLLSSVVSVSANASIKQQPEVKYVGDMQFASFCKAVVNDDVSLFKMTLNRFVGELGSSRKSVLKRVTEEQSVQCAGKDLLDFTQQRNASSINSYLNTSKV